jgi:hypothetical protein
VIGIAPPAIPRLTRKAYHLWAARRLESEIATLEAANASATAPLLGTAPADISMTTHGKRISSVHLALESIGRGEVLPQRVILWLDDPAALRNLPPSLRRLQARGLEVRATKNYGPHTKYWPYVSSVAAGMANAPTLVTADDDVILPKYWLRRLLDRSRPATLTVYRAHRVGLNPNGSFAPYNEWEECWTTEPSFANFPTGVSGIAYPVEMQAALRQAGTRFLDRAPRADDIWLHHISVAAAIQTQQVFRWPLEFPLTPDSQTEALYLSNVHESRNDEQIASTYESESRLRILRAATSLTNN